MRPTVRLLLVALGALAMTGVMIPLVEGWLALLPWLVLGGFLFADITASWRPGLRMRLIGANQIFASESRSLQLELSQPAPRGLSISIEWCTCFHHLQKTQQHNDQDRQFLHQWHLENQCQVNHRELTSDHPECALEGIY